jgi:hypothetical protein
MTRRRTVPWALALLLLLPSGAHADGLILAAEVGESYAWLSPWGQGEPLTEIGLRGYAVVDDELDLGLGIRLGKPWGGDLVNAGSMKADFTMRFHDDIDSYSDESDFEPFFMFSAVYSHLWAEDPAAAGAPTTWTTREGFGLRLGGGFLVTAEEFYFDMTAYGIAELLWPEPSFLAGGGLDLAMGVYLD